MSNCCFTAFDAKLFLIPVFSFFSQLLIPLVNLVSQEDQIRPFKRRRRKKKVGIFPFVGCHKYVPPLLARFSVGKPDGNFITRTDQTNSDVS